MDQEVRDLAGERYQRRENQQPFRWDHEKGFLVVDGQTVPIQRPRLRSEEGREESLGSYELFRRGEPLDALLECRGDLLEGQRQLQRLLAVLGLFLEFSDRPLAVDLISLPS